MKIGAITIGQAPRTDVTADILHIFDDSLELVQPAVSTVSQKNRLQNCSRQG
mgnify:FL=1